MIDRSTPRRPARALARLGPIALLVVVAPGCIREPGATVRTEEPRTSRTSTGDPIAKPAAAAPPG